MDKGLLWQVTIAEDTKTLRRNCLFSFFFCFLFILNGYWDVKLLLKLKVVKQLTNILASNEYFLLIN